MCWLFTSEGVNLILVGKAKVTALINRVARELIQDWR